MLRNVILSPDYSAFEQRQTLRVKEKLRYAVSILENQSVLSTKFVKKLINTDFYELRIAADLEIRILLLPIDHPNVMQARKLLLLNGFVKKSMADYTKAMRKAMKILNECLD